MTNLIDKLIDEIQAAENFALEKAAKLDTDNIGEIIITPDFKTIRVFRLDGVRGNKKGYVDINLIEYFNKYVDHTKSDALLKEINSGKFHSVSDLYDVNHIVNWIINMFKRVEIIEFSFDFDENGFIVKYNEKELHIEYKEYVDFYRKKISNFQDDIGYSAMRNDG